MTVRLRIDDSGILAAAGKLKQLAPDHSERSDMMRQIGDYMLNSTRRNFEKETDPNSGQRWTALSNSTLISRAGGPRKAYSKQTGQLTNRAVHITGSAKILRDSGRLFKSVHRQFNANSAIVGSNLVYAGVHQAGSDKAGRNKQTKIPARPFLGLSAKDKVQVTGIIDGVMVRLSRGVA